MRAPPPLSTSSSNAGDLVVAGVVGKPFGIHGEVFVFPDPDIADEFAPGTVCTADPGPDLVVADSRVHRARRLVRFEGIDDRDAAERLRGTVLHLPRTAAMLDDDALWTSDLLGREVVDDTGTPVGVVESARDGTAHDYLVIRRPRGGELLIPAVAELVDVDADPIVVHAIPGLLDEVPDEN